MPKILHYVFIGHLDWLLWSAKSIFPHLLLNVALFVPLGLALPFVYRKSSLIKVLLTGFSISLFIEFGQFFIGRESEIDDLICNALGAILGFGIYKLVKKLFPKFTEKAKISANDVFQNSSSQDVQ